MRKVAHHSPYIVRIGNQAYSFDYTIASPVGMPNVVNAIRSRGGVGDVFLLDDGRLVDEHGKVIKENVALIHQYMSTYMVRRGRRTVPDPRERIGIVECSQGKCRGGYLVLKDGKVTTKSNYYDFSEFEKVFDFGITVFAQDSDKGLHVLGNITNGVIGTPTRDKYDRGSAIELSVNDQGVGKALRGELKHVYLDDSMSNSMLHVDDHIYIGYEQNGHGYRKIPYKHTIKSSIKKIGLVGPKRALTAYILTEDGKLYGAGANNKGQLGHPYGNPKSTDLLKGEWIEVPVSEKVHDIYFNTHGGVYIVGESGKMYYTGALNKDHNLSGISTRKSDIFKPLEIKDLPFNGKDILVADNYVGSTKFMLKDFRVFEFNSKGEIHEYTSYYTHFLPGLLSAGKQAHPSTLKGALSSLCQG